jgi:hypothetical protein
MAAYRRASRFAPSFGAICILLVIGESWRNALEVTPGERLMVIMPFVVGIGLVCALASQATLRRDMPRDKLAIVA